jgi:hypothetical protein
LLSTEVLASFLKPFTSKKAKSVQRHSRTLKSIKNIATSRSFLGFLGSSGFGIGVGVRGFPRSHQFFDSLEEGCFLRRQGAFLVVKRLRHQNLLQRLPKLPSEFDLSV